MSRSWASAARCLVCLAVLLGLVAGLPGVRPCLAAQLEPGTADPLSEEAPLEDRLDAISESISPISAQVKLRRSVAHATFCLPQNVLGILWYGFLRVAGQVQQTREMNETTIVVIGGRAGASLGRYLFIPGPYLTESAVRHEYGHTMQGYRHGPFYLLFEGLASFLQAGLSAVSPRFAAGYFERWPEDEANVLGGVPQLPGSERSTP